MSPRRNHRVRPRKSLAGTQVCHRGYSTTVTDCGKQTGETRWSRKWPTVTCDDCKTRREATSG